MKFRFLVLILFLWGVPKIFTQEIKSLKDKTIIVEKYSTFLNESQTPSDNLTTSDGIANPNDLYDEKMSSVIIRSGEPGSYYYRVATSSEEVGIPISFLSTRDAKHFCDWKNSSASTSTFNFICCALGTTSIDPYLKSNLLTFHLVSTGTKAYQSMEGELVEAPELTETEVIFEGLALFFSMFGPAGIRNFPAENISHFRDHISGQERLQEGNLLGRTTEMNINLETRFHDAEKAVPRLTAPQEERKSSNALGHAITHEELLAARDRRKTSFDPNAIAEKESKPTSLKSHTVKITEEGESREFREAFKRSFKKIAEEIDERTVALPQETTHEVAAIYAAAYPRLKEKLQEFISALKENPSFQNKKSAKLLTDQTTEFLRMVPKMFDLSKMEKIKTQNGSHTKYFDDLVLIKRIPYGSEEWPSSEDEKAYFTLWSVNNCILAFEDFNEVFRRSTPEDMQSALKRALVGEAGEDDLLARMQDLTLLERKTTESSQKECTEKIKSSTAFDNLPINIQGIKKLAFTQIINLSQKALAQAEELKIMFLTRINFTTGET